MKRIIILILLFLNITGTIALEFAGGSGTKNDPYLVANAQQLDHVRNHPDKYFFQIADIDLNVAPYNVGNYWVPIGGNRYDNETGNNFSGHYNGNGYIIYNLTIVQPGNKNVGLFGHIGSAGSAPTTIKNVTIENVIIIGGVATGALVGRVTGNQNTRIENCSVTNGYVRGDAATGGLVGSNNSYMVTSMAAEGYRPVIYQCSANVSVLLRSQYSEGKIKFGGLVGCNQKGMISHCYTLGDVTINSTESAYIGGLVGCNELRGLIINSYSSAGVYTDSTSHTGGFVGNLGVGRNRGIVIDSYWNTDYNPEYLNTLGATALTGQQMQQSEYFPEWDFVNKWNIESHINYGFPHFVAENAHKTLITWNGSQDSDWHNPENWTPAGVPDISSVIEIVPAFNNPVISTQVTVGDINVYDLAEIIVEYGSEFVITGNLSVGGEYTGLASFSGKGCVTIEGNALQNIPMVTFDNLVISNFNNVQLSGTVHINESIIMSNGLLDLNGQELILGPQAMVSEFEDENISSRIYGESGVISTIRYLDQPHGEIAGLGLEINSAKNLGWTLIERGHSELNGTDDSKSLLRWFNIEPENNQGLDATLVFHYFASELNLYGENDNFSLFKRKKGETEWIWVPSEVDAFTKTLVAENVDGFSTWTAGSSYIALPIVLLSFEGVAHNREIELTWTTAAEINNDFFTLERSTNGVDFEPIAWIQGAGTTSQTTHYSHWDTDPLTGITYYRLKQTDLNGMFEYSDIISVYSETIIDDVLSVHPNPNNGKFNLLLNGEDTYEYHIYDMQGRLLQRATANAGMVTPVEVSHLRQGLYTLVVFGRETLTEKIQVY